MGHSHTKIGQCHTYTPYETRPSATSGATANALVRGPSGGREAAATSAAADNATRKKPPRYSHGDWLPSCATTKNPTTATRPTAPIASKRCAARRSSTMRWSTHASAAPISSAWARVNVL